MLAFSNKNEPGLARFAPIPLARSNFTMCEPRKPAPPVTIILFRVRSSMGCSIDAGLRRGRLNGARRIRIDFHRHGPLKQRYGDHQPAVLPVVADKHTLDAAERPCG